MSNYTFYRFKCSDDAAVERMLNSTEEEDTCCKGYYDENGEWNLTEDGDEWYYTSEESLFDLLYLHIDNKEIFETIGYDEGERDSENDYTGEPLREYDPDDVVEPHWWLNNNPQE